MTWGRLDDSFDGHRKRRLASLAADGLLARAIAHAAKHETNGFVDLPWIQQQGKTAERRRALREAVDARMLEKFDARDVREIHAPARKGIRDRPRTVTVGPFDVDGYLIHDFLDFNPAAEDLAEKRARDRAKAAKRRAVPRLWNGQLADGASPGDTPGVSGKGTSSTATENENGDHSELHAGAAEHEIATAERIVAIFDGFSQPIDLSSVLNAIARFPNRAHEDAARGCAEYLRSHPDKPPGLTFHRYLEREKPRAAGRSKTERDRDGLEALARLTGHPTGETT